MEPLSKEDRRILIVAMQAMDRDDGNFSGILEWAIAKVKNYPALLFIPENRELRHARYVEREAIHRRIVS